LGVGALSPSRKQRAGRRVAVATGSRGGCHGPRSFFDFRVHRHRRRAVAAAVAYWILSADEAPTLPFAIAQYTLLASVLIGGLDGLTKCRARR
jgi:hypothetical protein